MDKGARQEQRRQETGQEQADESRAGQIEGKATASFSRAAAILRSRAGLSARPEDAFELSRLIGNSAMLGLKTKRAVQIAGELDLHGGGITPYECGGSMTPRIGGYADISPAGTTAFPTDGFS